MHKSSLIAAALTALIAVGSGPAAALEARASGNISVREGPSDRYEVIGQLRNGRYYEVEDCTRQSRWCLVSQDGDLIGWVLGSYLVGSGAKNAVTPPEFLEWPGFDRRGFGFSVGN